MRAPIFASAFGLALVALAAFMPPAMAQSSDQKYSSSQLVDAGHRFFGGVTGGLAGVLEVAVERYGLPNGYILGEEASGAFVGGLRYGEGVLHTRNAGSHKVFWQGPSVGWDVGGDGDRVMMLVYDLPSVQEIHRRYVGVNGAAYFVAGFGMTVLSNNDITLVPVRTGVGARLGVNVGYLKFTPTPTWNPF
ncbi:hypothetical protein GGD81_002087 [Rhodobium orientis]|uniref:DUF1134 domain-containing protein n=1 Tax=Rhodobium orientis TaxID=34017 RepID=A0A327JV60_9HYPH|nr:DUF1134 domain-containing protein [Rhodobium orientis]MBB4303049.1 hypothetical protein [Rhodobium orientis]MBK5947988.1 hypothetical protein [Rhodobium orientis]RAI29393.1 hypothetical protein CH339_03675 [Rhodobium orientis]